MLKIVGVIIWALFSLLIAGDISEMFYRIDDTGYYVGYPGLEPLSFGKLSSIADRGLVLWLLTWVVGIILWIVLSTAWRRLRSPAHKAGRHS